MILSLQDVARAREFYAKGYWRDDTFYTLLRRRAEEAPDSWALRDINSRLSYRDVLEWVDSIAESLHEAGVREGERVSIWLPSRVESAMILLACSRMGYVCNTSMHRDHTCQDVMDLIKRAGSVAFFGQSGWGADADRSDIFELLADLPQIKRCYRVPPLDPTPRVGDASVRFSELRKRSGSTLPYRTDPDRVMYLAFTSGTTGRPKGVMHSDNTVLSNARPFIRDWSFGPDTVLYTLSPMSHNIGTVGLATMLVSGGEFVVNTPYDAKRTLDRALEVEATSMLGVPTNAIDVLTEARRRGLTRLGKVTTFQVGGAPVPPALVRGLFEMGVTPKNGFGMTENCSFQYTRPNDPPELIMHSCGRSCEGFELKIWNQEDPDHEVELGELGELGVRGACLMLGYFNDQEATERSFNRHGWFMTGDLGRLDEAGNVRIAGRKKDLIIRGGHNIHPAKIEDYAMRHAGVIKAAAFPVPDERLGEKVCLAVIPKTLGAVTSAELLNHMAELGLSKYEMPEFFIELEAFPLTPSGKVLKRGLVELVASGDLSPQAVRYTTQG
jgi:acyl-CoA synthetase